MTPVVQIGSSLMLFGAYVDGTNGLSDVNGIFALFTFHQIHAGHVFRVMTCFVGTAQHVFKFGAGFANKVDASFVTRPFKLMVSAIREIWNNHIWLAFFLGRDVSTRKWKDFK